MTYPEHDPDEAMTRVLTHDAMKEALGKSGVGLGGYWADADEASANLLRDLSTGVPLLDVDRLRRAIYTVSVRHDWATTLDTEDRTEEIAREYAAERHVHEWRRTGMVPPTGSEYVEWTECVHCKVHRA